MVRSDGSRYATPGRAEIDRASDDLEVAREFPVRDVLAELPLFPFARRGEVLDEGVAERARAPPSKPSGAARPPTSVRGSAERSGNLLVVRVAVDQRLRLDLVLDAPQTRAERRGEDRRRGSHRRPRSRYSTRCDLALPGITRSAHVRFSTPQVASVGAQKPGIRRRVGVDRRRDHRQQLRHQPLLAADEPAHRHRSSCALRCVVEHRLAARVLERQVNVPALAGPVAATTSP